MKISENVLMNLVVLKKITEKKLMKQPIVLQEFLKYYLHPILLRTRIKNGFLLGLAIIQGDGYI